MADKKHVRSWRNSARLKPRTHLLVILFVAAVVALAVALSCYLFHVYFHQILKTIAVSGSLTPETNDFINELFFDLLWMIGIIETTILFAVALVSLNYVFKFTGAEYALSRHIREKLLNGEWEPIRLRKGDALTTISEELNKLSEQHAARNNGTP
jgi:hypothetical protein